MINSARSKATEVIKEGAAQANDAMEKYLIGKILDQGK